MNILTAIRQEYLAKSPDRIHDEEVLGGTEASLARRPLSPAEVVTKAAIIMALAATAIGFAVETATK